MVASEDLEGNLTFPSQQASFTNGGMNSPEDYEVADDDSSSDGDAELGNMEQQDTKPPKDGAEHLVQSETRAVRILRAVVILLLLTATTLTGIFTHRLSVKNQLDSFAQDFQDRANQLVTKFESGIGSLLYQSYTISVAMSDGMYTDSNPNFPYVRLANLDRLASSLRLQARALDVVWSPLLKTRRERTNWEEYAANSQQNSNASSPTGGNQPCNLCGDGNEVVNPENQVTAPGIGTFTCQSVQNAAMTGFLKANECATSSAAFPTLCGCRKSSEVSSQQNSSIEWPVSKGIYRLENGTAVPDDGPAPFSPVWQFAPKEGGKQAIMFNQMSDPRRRKAIKSMLKYSTATLSESFDPTTNAFYEILQTPATTFGIIGVLMYPVFQSFESNNIVGLLAIDFSWKLLFEIGLNDKDNQSDGIFIVLENTCGQVYSFQVVGNRVEYIGEGDHHDTMVKSKIGRFQSLMSAISPRENFQTDVPSNSGCAYNVRVYPSNKMRSRYLTSKPWVETFVVVSIFLFTSTVFLMYDLIGRRLQVKVMNSAKRSEAIVSSMFPAVIRDRLYGEGTRLPNNCQGTPQTCAERKQVLGVHLGHSLLNHKIRLKTFLAEPTSDDVTRESEPIADLFPNTIILFADIAGFTAWSSEREPSQVFKLLETLYGAFDQVANKRGVFKIETIGDCYVAVTGLPEPREDHAVVMAKFAFECLIKMNELTKRLESTLGPGTADLAIRVGLHSGPVTGGVLRGERARFQLFGDTMNTASRMESTGKVNHIHVSKETADLLIKAGKSDWVKERSELVKVKGKGEMQTYWVKPSKQKKRNASLSESPSEDARSSSGYNGETVWGAASLDTALSSTSSGNRHDRLVAWNADILEQFLQKIVVRRKATMTIRSVRRSLLTMNKRSQADIHVNVIDEISEIIKMPEFDEQIVKAEMDPALVDIGKKVRIHLRGYVASIAALYHDNAFHNFEHASHVVMSASKLLKRIISPDDVDYRTDETGKMLKSHTDLSREIHQTTYGISSDPLMQFAVVFSALIHDVDHTGLQNRQLIKKKDPLALTYFGKCVAEQHSVRRAWDIMMEDRFADLRRCIYQTDDDRLRFRQLVINAVIATDIADKELQLWRQSRWDKAFHEQEDDTTMDRKATILFEYILQASDVAPTMQHWHVYQKWNQRLFEERYVAYMLGNDDEDPSTCWYEGELAFFDNYIIPLARNLEESNAFGVSCDEYLAYALENRREWEIKGEQIVTDTIASHLSLIVQLASEHALRDEVMEAQQGVGVVHTSAIAHIVQLTNHREGSHLGF